MEREHVVRVKIGTTIDENIVKWVDDLVERGLFRNRSHAVEEALRYVKKVGIEKILMEKLKQG